MGRHRYRAWNIETRQLAPVTTLNIDGGVVVVNGRIAWDVTNVILMQCTGVTDRTGQAIYEGDIVEAWSAGSHGRFEVRWRDTGAPLWLLWPAYQEGQFWYLYGPQDTAATVLGNVYEHPHLAPKAPDALMNRASQ